MIVLHVARARTDSINIRGSLGKTRAALWITNATFLYFSRCNAHTPFTLFPFLALFLSFFLIPLSSPSRLPSFYGFPLLARHHPPFLSFIRARHVASFLFRFTHPIVFFSPLSVFHSRPVSTHDPLLFHGIDGDALLSNYTSPLRIVTLPAEMETASVSYSRARGTELPDNPLICPVITSHRPSSI